MVPPLEGQGGGGKQDLPLSELVSSSILMWKHSTHKKVCYSMFNYAQATYVPVRESCTNHCCTSDLFVVILFYAICIVAEALRKIKVPVSLSAEEFHDILKNAFPRVGSTDFELARVDCHKKITRLQVSPLSPSLLKASRELNRSAIYILPKVMYIELNVLFSHSLCKSKSHCIGFT